MPWSGHIKPGKKCSFRSRVFRFVNFVEFWSKKYGKHPRQVKAIINAQCSQCSSDGICRLWNNHFDVLKSTLDIDGSYFTGATYAGDKTPSSYCDQDQCAVAAQNYKKICPAYSVCVDKCTGSGVSMLSIFSNIFGNFLTWKQKNRNSSETLCLPKCQIFN